MMKHLRFGLTLSAVAVLVFAGVFCQQTPSGNTTEQKECPLKQMGQSCQGNEENCPAKQGKGPCNSCKEKADQMVEKKLQEFSRKWNNALDNKEYDKAIDLLNQLDKEIPSGMPIKSNIKSSFAYVYTLKGDYDKAIGVYNEMLKDFPDDPGLLCSIANIHSEKGEYDKAIELFNRVIKRYPNEPRIIDGLACIYMKKGDYDKAIDIYNKLLDANPKATFVYYNMCCAYSLNGSKDKSCEYLERAVVSGFVDWKHMEKDTDLDNIRGEERYKKIIETLKAKYPNGMPEGCGGDCQNCPSKAKETDKPADDHKHMHEWCDQCPDHDKCLKEGKCAGDCEKKKPDTQKCDGSCDHKDAKNDPKCTDDCEHKKHKK